MAGDSDASGLIKNLGGALYPAILALIGFITSGSTGLWGSALGYLLPIISGCIGIWFWALHVRYAGIIATSDLAVGDEEREGYVALRRNLRLGGAVSGIYARWLEKFLDKVEGFFGDRGTAGNVLVDRSGWLRNPKPLWTPPAFDRCLLLALIYPIITIFLFWAISGHAGPAGEALGLVDNPDGWSLALVSGVFAIMCLAYWQFGRTQGWKRFA